MIELVAASGSGEHRLQEHWNASMRSFCRASDAHGRDYFCNTDVSRWFLQHTSSLGTWTP
jgi:hypothetical protein